MKYGIVVSKWYQDLYTKPMLQTALDEFQKHQIKDVSVLWVPGSYEIPYGAQKLCDQGYTKILTLGVIIRGETSHYDHICQACASGVMRVSLDNKTPIIFGVLTCENDQQVKERLKKVSSWVDNLIKIN